MPINKEMLKILCCPISKVSIMELPQDKLAVLNNQITAGKVKDNEGNAIKDQLKEALVTSDYKMIYRVDEDIPVMLAESGIPVEGLDGF